MKTRKKSKYKQKKTILKTKKMWERKRFSHLLHTDHYDRSHMKLKYPKLVFILFLHHMNSNWDTEIILPQLIFSLPVIMFAWLIIEFTKMMIHIFMPAKKPPVTTAHIVLTIIADLTFWQIGIEIFAISFCICMYNYICQFTGRGFHHFIFQFVVTDSYILTISAFHNLCLSSMSNCILYHSNTFSIYTWLYWKIFFYTRKWNWFIVLF